MLFRRFLQKYGRAKERTKKRVKITLNEKGEKRKVSGTLVPGEVPYFVSDDREVRGHICDFGDMGLHFVPDKK